MSAPLPRIGVGIGWRPEIAGVLTRLPGLRFTEVVSAANRGGEPGALLARLPLERIAYVHVAGGAEHDGLYHDTHTDPVPPEVLALLGELCALHRPPPVLLERDGGYPPEAQLRAELDAVARAARLPPITGEVPAR